MPQADRAQPHAIDAVGVVGDGGVPVMSPRVAHQPAVGRVERDKVGPADGVAEARVGAAVVDCQVVEALLLGETLGREARLADAGKW